MQRAHVHAVHSGCNLTEDHSPTSSHLGSLSLLAPGGSFILYYSHIFYKENVLPYSKWITGALDVFYNLYILLNVS